MLGASLTRPSLPRAYQPEKDGEDEKPAGRAREGHGGVNLWTFREAFSLSLGIEVLDYKKGRALTRKAGNPLLKARTVLHSKPSTVFSLTKLSVLLC